MDYINFGVSDLKVSRVGVGTWAIGGAMWGGTDKKDAIRTLQAAVDMGITLIDTAPVYGFGQAEDLVGEALAEGGRLQRAVIATKCGLNFLTGDVFRDSRKEIIRKELEDSLKRLKTDHIDIYQIHYPDPLTPFEETAALMDGFFREGKIRAIGVSNFSVSDLEEWRKYGSLHSIQPSYNILEDKLPNTDTVKYAIENDIKILAYSSLARGLLSGKYSKDTKFPDGDMRQKDDPKFQGEDFVKHIAAVDELKEYAGQFGKTVAQLAVRWVLDKGVTVALWGARKPEQLEQIEGVSGWVLTDAQLAEMEAIVEKHVPVQIGKEFLYPPARPDGAA
jgi:aryl-alcohol dehydrogenase-like predicted oxidoreductase